jgi:hypothetical protein
LLLRDLNTKLSYSLIVYLNVIVMRQVRFNELSIVDKAMLIAEFGNFLRSTDFYNYRVHLYALNENFIEVYYNVETRQVERITLAMYEHLDKYMSAIILPSIRKTN